MKKVIVLIATLLISLSLTGCIEKEKEYKYKITLYNLNEIEKVDIDPMDQYGNTITIDDKSTIKIIYYIFSEKKTDLESISDEPLSTDILYKVTFKTEKDSRELFIYKKDGEYFLESPKYGIYETTEEEFNKLEKLVKDNTYQYTLRNYDIDDITSVVVNTLGQYDEPVEVTEKKHIKILYDIFSGKKSNTKSEDYNPTNHGTLFHVIFKTDYDQDGKEYYIYKKNDKYYIEESLYAIYESSENEFLIVENYTETNKEE